MGTRTSALRKSNRSAGEPVKYEKLEGYLNNLDPAATNKKAVLQKLSAAVASLIATNEKLVMKIKALTARKKYLGGLESYAKTAKPGKGKVKGLLDKGESRSLHHRQVLTHAWISRWQRP